MKEVWFVRGGVYTDGTFTKLEPGTEENYGPFDTEEAANRVWSGKTRQNIDICWHKLSVIKETVPTETPSTSDKA